MAVPEAAVNKDQFFSPDKRDIRTSLDRFYVTSVIEMQSP